MFDVLRIDPRRTALICLAFTFGAVVYLEIIVAQSFQENHGQFGVPTDETWVHVRFASHIADGQGLTFNDGTLSTGDASPLWVLVLAPIYSLLHPDNTGRVVIAAILSSVGFILSVWAITGLSWWLTQRAWIGLMAGLLTALTGRLIWFALSGLETTTFVALTLLVIWSHLEDLRAMRPAVWRTGILLALATLTRPEGYLLTAIVVLDIAAVAIPREKAWWAAIAALFASWRAILVYGLLAGAYMLLYLAIGGYPLPNSLRAYAQPGWQFSTAIDGFTTSRIDFGPILLILIGVGMLLLVWSSWRRQIPGWALVLWPNLLVVLAVIVGTDRYETSGLNQWVVPAIPYQILAMLVAFVALWEFIGNFLADMRAKQFIQIGAMIAIPFAVFAQGYGIAARVPVDVDEVQRIHLKAADFIEQATRPGQLIALNDIGAIAQVSNRPVLDLVGLVSPEVLAAQDGSPWLTCPYDLQLARVMLRESPVLIGVFPDRYPCLSRWPGAWEPLRAFSVPGQTFEGGSSMVIAAPVWDKWPMLREIPRDTRAVNTVFAQGIELAAYRAEVVQEGLKVTLWWRVHGRPAADYHVFMHLFDAFGTLRGQNDGQPQSNQFPTSWWRTGDIIRDEHLIPLQTVTDLTIQELSLDVGLYNVVNVYRLVVENVAAGSPPDLIKIPLKVETAQS